jgi:sugar (pentulose or hexulose) kinase
MGKRYFMVLDFGTGAGRCSLVEVGGREHYSAQQEWFFEAPPDAQPGGFCFDPQKFWQVLGGTAKAALARGGIKPSQVIAVSGTSIREGFVLLDRSGQEIFAVPNRDARAYTESKEIGEKLGQALNGLSGHWPGPNFAPCRFLWLRRHQPEIIDRTQSFLMINDWVLYRLCGEQACEPTNASETSLYDIKAHRWGEEMIRTCEIPLHIFPPIIRSGQVLGKITPSAAEATGLLPGTPVVVSGADSQCGVLGSDGLRPGEAVVVAGTSTPIQMVLDSPVIDARARTWTGPHVLHDRWVLESNAGITGSILRWFRDSFCQEEKKAAEQEGVDPYSLMEQLAEKSPIGSSGVTALMGPRIMNARLLMSPAKVTGFSVAVPRSMVAEIDSKPHFIRAILESYAFAVRGNCAQLEEIWGQKLRRVIVCGGSSVSNIWMQMLADNLGIPVERPLEREASALGAAVCAGIGVKEYADFSHGVKVLVKSGGRFEPRGGNRPAYDIAYERWLSFQNR